MYTFFIFFLFFSKILLFQSLYFPNPFLLSICITTLHYCQTSLNSHSLLVSCSSASHHCHITALFYNLSKPVSSFGYVCNNSNCLKGLLEGINEMCIKLCSWRVLSSLILTHQHRIVVETWSLTAWHPVPACHTLVCTLGRPLKLSVPQFPHL